MMKRLPALILLVVVLVLAVVLVRGCLSPRAVAPRPIRVDTVPTKDITHDRPSPLPPKGPTRIIRVPVPVYVRITDSIPDAKTAGAFARAVFRAESLRAVVAKLKSKGDTAGADSAARAAPKPILAPTQGKYNGKMLALYLTQSDGRVMEATARVRPHFTWSAGQGGTTDTLPLIVQDRWWVRAGRETLGCLPGAALMAGGGALLDRDHAPSTASLVALVSLASCLAD